jgi:hypothetical protein
MLDSKPEGSAARQQPQHTQQGFQAPQDEGVKPHIPQDDFSDGIPF